MNLTLNIIDINGINFTGVDQSTLEVYINGSLTSGSSIVNEVIPDDTNVDIAVTPTMSFLNFNQTIEVYNEDLIINIVIAPIVPILDSQYQRTYPYITTIRNPYTGDYNFYNTSSSIGLTEWYTNNTKVGEGFRYIQKFHIIDSYSVKARSYILSGCDLIWDRYAGSIEVGNLTRGIIDLSVEDYLNLDLEPNLIVLDYKPVISLEYSAPSSTIDEVCYVLGETVSITNSIVTTTTNNWNLEIIVDSPLGENIESLLFSDITSSELAATSNYIPDITLLSQGTYTITLLLTNNSSGDTFRYTFYIYVCNVIEFKYIDCNTFTLRHIGTGLPPASVDIIYHQTNESIGDTIIISSGESVEVVLSDIGIYRVTATLESNSYTREYNSILNTFCSIENCITDYITSLLCEPCDPCIDKCEYEFEYMKFHSLLHTYYSKLQQEFGFNNIYTGFDIEKLNTFTEIQDIINILSRMCDCKGWIPSETSGCGDTSDTSDCGCGCGGSSTSNCGCSK